MKKPSTSDIMKADAIATLTKDDYLRAFAALQMQCKLLREKGFYENDSYRRAKIRQQHDECSETLGRLSHLVNTVFPNTQFIPFSL